VTVARRTAGEADVVVTGDLDVAGTPELVERLDELVEAGVTQVVLDLSGVTFVDASALGLLLRTKSRLEMRQGSFRVVYEDNPYLARLLGVTGLDALLG
jgi:anti-sigma B factor antagonist